MKPATNMSQRPSKLGRPQEEEEEEEEDNQHALSIGDLRSLSFSYMQRFEDESKTQAKRKIPFRDQCPENDFEFCSPVSNPTNVDILFCGKIIRQRESDENHSSKIGFPATDMPMKFPYQRATHVPRSTSSKRTKKPSYGLLAFHPEIDLSEMKKRQASLDQRESMALVSAAAACTYDLESGIAAGCDHHDKKKLGLIRRMRSKGNIISVLACYPLAAPVMKPN